MANTQTGQVIKSVNAKTLTVKIITYKNHPLYKKRYVYSKKYLVHDPEGLGKVEDRVVIRQSRPISRRKRWVLDKVLASGGHAGAVKSDLQAIEAAAVPPAAETEKAEKPDPSLVKKKDSKVVAKPVRKRAAPRKKATKKETDKKETESEEGKS